MLIAPGHGEFSHFFGGAGIGLGYGDQKTIEVYHAMKNVASGTQSNINFRFGCKVNMVIDAVLQSAQSGKWVEVK